jgi:uncharacterized protein YdeI (YjbR/CyaY-like superfamily)
MKISYEYKVQNTAFVNDGKQMVPVGVCEQSSRDGQMVKMTVKFFKHIPKELLDLLQENPQLMSMKEIKLKCETVVMLPEGGDIIV